MAFSAGVNRSVLLLGIVCTSCSSGSTKQRSVDQAEISDSVHNHGTPGMYWLPPLVAMPTFSGTFDPTLSPVFEIDRIDPATSHTLEVVTTMTTQGSGEERVR